MKRPIYYVDICKLVLYLECPSFKYKSLLGLEYCIMIQQKPLIISLAKEFMASSIY